MTRAMRLSKDSAPPSKLILGIREQRTPRTSYRAVVWDVWPAVDRTTVLFQMQHGDCFKEQAVMKPDITAYLAATYSASHGMHHRKAVPSIKSKVKVMGNLYTHSLEKGLGGQLFLCREKLFRKKYVKCDQDCWTVAEWIVYAVAPICTLRCPVNVIHKS